MRQTGTGWVSALPAWDTLLAGDLPAHTHAESDVTNLAMDLTNRPVKGAAWAISKAAVIHSSGQLDGAAETAMDGVPVNGTSAAKANAVRTHAESGVTGLATDLASKAAKPGGTFTGTLRVGGDQAYIECGPYAGGENDTAELTSFSVQPGAAVAEPDRLQPGNLWRGCPLGPVLPQRIDNGSLTSLPQRLVKTGGRLVKNARFYWLMLAQGPLTRWLFGAIVRRVAAWPVAAG